MDVHKDHSEEETEDNPVRELAGEIRALTAVLTAFMEATISKSAIPAVTEIEAPSSQNS